MSALSAATSLRVRPGAPLFVFGDFSETALRLRRLGYGAVELLLRHPDEAERADVPAILERHELRLRTILTGSAFVSDGLSLSNSATATEAVDRVVAHIGFAARHGASVVLGWMLGRYPQDAVQRRRAERVLAESLRRCHERAGDAGVELLLEPVNRYESNIAATVAEMVMLADRAGAPLGVVMDLFHANIEEADLEQTALQFGARIRHVHISDSNRLAPGHGHITFGPLFAALEKGGFNGTLGIEALPLPDVATAAAAAMRAYRTFQEVPA